MRPTGCALLLCALALLGAGGQPALPPGTFTADEAPAELRGAVGQADLLIVEMHGSLLQELTSGLARGGPAQALRSCHVDVQGLIGQIGRREGLKAGRTSVRLRNPANAAPAWAAPMVEAHVDDAARDTPGYVADLGDRVGVLRPISERPMCDTCHGTDDERPADVRAALAERYPEDRAVGFRDGAIRGWFWVEVPKSTR
jgi:Protein of unknown function (DUF3365)